ncbi:MAG: AbrB/MazE/SpoVT family DNA-binding domain-containing protein [Microcoleus sp. PH2017_10_PVI_O_A]|jgi:antitoxin MazE|uniref:AbrB/MazE/SpoVT family DNA-binding domain-containing protein n=1 Tax=unclassified Microcoleus TaxID=2642155 RepID=UPI001DCF4CDF|nr:MULTISPECIES: AbrB/MazE/SpoVT family DNA-binding domain-containing protein [unclassified Microcoleus]TAE77630.1 MAG: AbrB/MazE/SpoVT family DNA-binding domain-containing protein [Oscillatoriales cyanobacterium]MCC3409050.1 AbrB/MazE/SpoVT family DNA-binding domain-containing protein [Microcoleus sp. PH2017_10_PVI_O_A]MCC3463176.1 AbrB/MazE/SpoVT family DNA-binding domain-containing protein [Microcoleus sp. PH2017_11_PCY_U_A]MCC3481600.1 AbrB/MazE/SpoVT family DNA-binding domain-containing pr
MVGTIAKWGNSLAVRIPQHLAKEINLVEGSEVQLVLIDGRLTIEPITRRRYSLEELIEAITPENLHTEIDSGVAVGNEVW